MLETIVHFVDREDVLPRTYTLLEIQLPDAVTSKEIMPLADANWREKINLTQKTGDEWIASRETALARVPSAIAPHTWNLLLNPLHPDAAKAEIVSVIHERFDPRFFGYGAR